MAQKITLEAIGNPAMLQKLLNAMQTEINALRTLANELRTDHATFRTHCVEVETWAEALATKLNADSGVNDVNYDATITNSPPATLAAAEVSAQTTKTV